MNEPTYLGNPNLKRANVQQEWTKKELLEYKRCMDDPLYFIQTYVKIVSLDEGLIPFKMYNFQKEMVGTFHNNRFTICKLPRQSGKSTTMISYLLHYALFNPSAGTGGNPPPGFSWNAHFPNSPISFGPDSCGGHPEQSGQYHYHDTHFLDCWREGSSIASYNDYYGSTQYNGDNIRHPDGHSKMVGISFDGFPIYGPFAYTQPWDSLSGTTTMSSSYSARDTEAPGRPDYGSTSENPPAGALIVDWEYVEGTGTLDYHNGRFCVTPEYPNGTYAYFLSVDDQNAPDFPYMVGLTMRETIDTTFTNQPVQQDQGGGDDGGDAPTPPTLQFTLQPQSATVNVGETATFTVNALIIPENGPISYQWYRSTDGGFAFAAITGATSASYSVTALAYMTGYKYRCRIIGPVPANNAQNSPLDSNQANLTVSGSGGAGNLQNRFDSTSSSFDSTAQSFDGT